MATDIVGLGFAQIYLSLMIDGVGSRPFSARTLPPIAEPKVNYIQEILDHSRVTFAKPRDVVEAAILKSTQGYDQKSERPDSGRPREGGASRDFIRNGDQRDAPRRAETRTDIRKPEYRSDTRRDVPDFKRDTRDIREPREEKSYRGVNRPEPIKKASAEAAPAESTPQLTEDHRAKLRAALQKISEKERAQNEKIRGRESADHTTEIPLQAHVNSATHSETVQVDPPKTQAYTTTDQEVSEDTLRQLLGADAV